MERFFHWPETHCGKQDSTWSGWSRKAHAVHSHDLPQSVEITVCTRAWRVTEIFHVHIAAARLFCASEMGREWLWPEAPECCYHRNHKQYEATSKGKNSKKYVFPQFLVCIPGFSWNFWVISAYTTFANNEKYLSSYVTFLKGRKPLRVHWELGCQMF